MIPGEYFVDEDAKIVVNAGKEAVTIEVVNRGDRPVQVGSHFHFAEVNSAIEFDRQAAMGKRLDIPSGTAVRLEPGDSRSVQLIDLGGRRQVFGFNNAVNGPLA